MSNLLSLCLLAGFCYALWCNQQAQQLAIAFAKRRCFELDFQFLDHTVARHHWYPARALNGQWRICRRYVFEYSRDGLDRHAATLVMLGDALLQMNLTDDRLN